MSMLRPLSSFNHIFACSLKNKNSFNTEKEQNIKHSTQISENVLVQYYIILHAIYYIYIYLVQYLSSRFMCICIMIKNY